MTTTDVSLVAKCNRVLLLRNKYEIDDVGCFKSEHTPDTQTRLDQAYLFINGNTEIGIQLVLMYSVCLYSVRRFIASISNVNN